MRRVRSAIACWLRAIADTLDPDRAELGYLAALRRLEPHDPHRLERRRSDVTILSRRDRGREASSPTA